MDLTGSTCGVTLAFKWICVHHSSTPHYSPSPFEQTMMLFTFGLLLVLVSCIPLFFIEMEGSISLIAGATILSILVLSQWVSASIINGLDPSRMPIAQSFSHSYVQTMGVIMLNMGCATVIPSWVNIKSMHVRTQSVMWTTVSSAAIFYIIIGVFFALGFDSNPSNNSLQALLDMGHPGLLSEITVAMYAYIMLLPSVPVNFAIARDNLVQNNIVGKLAASLLCFAVPVLVSIPLQTRNYLFLFLTWTTLTFIAVANFIIPLGIYLKAIEFRKEFNAGRILSPHQIALLIDIHADSHEIGAYIGRQNHEEVAVASGGDANVEVIPQVLPTIRIIDPSGNDVESITNKSIYGMETSNLLPEDQHQLQHRKSTSSRSSVSSEHWIDLFRNHGIDEYSKISMRSPQSLYQTMNSAARLDEESFNSSSPVEGLPIFQHGDSSSGQSGTGGHRFSPRIDDSWFAEDVPDPEQIQATQNNDVELNRVYQFDDQESLSSRMSRQSLPRDPNFKSPAFRAVPLWMPIQPRTLCWAFLVITSTVSLGNLVVQLSIYGLHYE